MSHFFRAPRIGYWWLWLLAAALVGCGTTEVVPTITAQTEPMPIFLKSVSPSAGSFMEGGPSKPICVTLNTQYMVEPGDHLATTEALLNKLMFSLNGNSDLALIDVGHELTETEATYPDGSTASWVSEYSLCWEAPFEEGFNEASITLLNKSNPPKTYQWYFEAINP